MGISKRVASCATLLAALAGGVALGMWSGDLFAGAEIKISMAGSKYAPAKVSARVGDTLNFVNDDTTDNWVYVPTVSQQVSGGPQKPGQRVSSLSPARPATSRSIARFIPTWSPK